MNYGLESPDSGPEGWGLRFTITLLFPKVSTFAVRHLPGETEHGAPGALTGSHRPPDTLGWKTTRL